VDHKSPHAYKYFTEQELEAAFGGKFTTMVNSKQVLIDFVFRFVYSSLVAGS
jgi:hypothetical protein